MKRWIPLVSLLAMPVSADMKTLLLLPFENATGQPSVAETAHSFPDLVNAYLSLESHTIQVVDREKLTDLMAEQGLKWENLTDEGASRRAAQMVQAKYLLRGSLTGTAEDLHIQAGLYEVETTALLKSFESHGAKKISTHAETIARALVRFLSEGAARPSLPADRDPEISRHRMQGLAFYHQGQYVRAFPEFMKVLAKKPKDADARYWLGKSFLGAGLRAQAQFEFERFLKEFAKDSRASEVQRLLNP